MKISGKQLLVISWWLHLGMTCLVFGLWFLFIFNGDFTQVPKITWQSGSSLFLIVGLQLSVLVTLMGIGLLQLLKSRGWTLFFIIVGLLLAGTILELLNAVGGFMVWKEKN